MIKIDIVAFYTYLILAIWFVLIAIYASYRIGLDEGKKFNPIINLAKCFNNAGKAMVSIGYSINDASKAFMKLKDLIENNKIKMKPFKFEPNVVANKSNEHGDIIDATLMSVSLVPKTQELNLRSNIYD